MLFTATVILPPALERRVCKSEEFSFNHSRRADSMAHFLLPAAADDDELVISFPPMFLGRAVTSEQPRLCTMLHLSSWLV